MKILSIDVGIKNLALCLLDIENKETFCIKKWNVINLCNEEKISCEYCKNTAKYFKNNTYYCKKHLSKNSLQEIPKELEFKKIKKLKIKEIRELLDNHQIQFNKNNSKILLLDEIKELFEKKFVMPFSNKIKSSEVSLITIGIELKKQLDLLYKNEKIDVVIIENQIGPLANRMKTLQGMLAQYFIMNKIENIEFVSPYNKLKIHNVNKNSNYLERKHKSIELCEEILINQETLNENLFLFQDHKKKDDLADCFLQGFWYLKEKLII